MYIAIPTEDGAVFGHFGKTQLFTIYEVKDGEILASHAASSAETGGHSALSAFLKEQNVNMVICGGIGQGAIDALESYGISVFAGASGAVKDVIEQFVAGTLKSTGNATCNHHHEEGHTCGSHTEGHTCGGNCGSHH